MQSLIRTFKFILFVLVFGYVFFCAIGGPVFMYVDGVKWYYCVLISLPCIHIVANDINFDSLYKE